MATVLGVKKEIPAEMNRFFGNPTYRELPCGYGGRQIKGENSH
jgi:hypothetical protein